VNPPALLSRCIVYAPALLDGAVTTLCLSVVAVIGGFFVGIFIYVISADDSPPVAGAARAYVSVFRGTPMLAQLLLFYYVPSALGLTLPGAVSAAIGLSLNTAAYQSQILATGFRSIPRGQIDAAQAFNLSARHRLWHIEIPQVVALTLPALVSEMIDIVKASAVVSVIAVPDLMRASQQLASTSYRPLEVYTFAACFYLAITSLLSIAGYGVERRLARHGRSLP
jgi:polar amino acid transport system permease protein